MCHVRHWLFLAAVLITSSVVAQPIIDATNWPYGSDQTGNHWTYYNTSSNTPVNITAINPYQQK